MDNFIVSARKYRPETFKSVVGQESITTTLKSAIRSQHLGHAYLFCGPRGVGKTTCARIFAKTINCNNPTEDFEPCNECESCKAFNTSRSYNIHELDAASNNSVDGIRTLIEQVRIPPQVGKYSVYIIDEVHMLSQQAFNAFLKTLEEPPSHAVFILATTEKHKIIPTILSRCQIYDFNRIKVDDAVKYLEYIASKESIQYEKEALHVIGQKADGAMRDALSIFDQVVSFSGSDIKYQSVIDNLNILDFEFYFRLTDSFLNANVGEALLIFDEILGKGFEPQNFLAGLSAHLRDLLVSLDPATIKLLEVSENLKTRYLEQSARCKADFLFGALDICNQAEMGFRSSHNQRLLVELSLVKLARLQEQKKKSLNQPPQEDEQEPKREDKPEPEVKSPPQAVNKAESNSTEQNHKDQEVQTSSANKSGVDTDTKPIGEPRKNVVKTPGISIKDVLNGNSPAEEEEENEPTAETDSENEEEVQENPFTLEDLTQYWHNFAQKIKQERPRISSTLINREPVLGKGNIVKLTLDNAAQLEDFNLSIKGKLQAYLRKNLGNSFIQIETLLDEKGQENANGRRKLYTPEDQFQYLNSKNPDLNKLKQQFNLDFE